MSTSIRILDYRSVTTIIGYNPPTPHATRLMSRRRWYIAHSCVSVARKKKINGIVFLSKIDIRTINSILLLIVLFSFLSSFRLIKYKSQNIMYL